MGVNLKNLAARMKSVNSAAETLTTIAHSETVAVKYIKPAKHNVCAQNDTEESVKTLAASIAADGLIHDLTVNKVSETEYHLISGERRFRAITEVLHWNTVQCRVYEHMSDNRAQLMLLEANLQVREYSAGEKLAFYKEAVGILKQMQEKAHQSEIAALLGVSTRQVRKYQEIVENLPDSDQKEISAGNISINEAVKRVKEQKKPEQGSQDEPTQARPKDSNGEEPLPGQVDFGEKYAIPVPVVEHNKKESVKPEVQSNLLPHGTDAATQEQPVSVVKGESVSISIPSNSILLFLDEQISKEETKQKDLSIGAAEQAAAEGACEAYRKTKEFVLTIGVMNRIMNSCS